MQKRIYDTTSKKMEKNSLKYVDFPFWDAIILSIPYWPFHPLSVSFKRIVFVMLGRKKNLFFLSLMCFFLFSLLLHAQEGIGGLERDDFTEDSDISIEAKNLVGPPPFLLDFTSGPFPFTRSYMTGYLNTADSHVLPQGRWRAGIQNVATFWSYSIFGADIDNNFLDSIFIWGLGLFPGIEATIALPGRAYYNSQIDKQGVDFTNPVNVYDGAISVKAVYKGEYAAAGMGLTVQLPVGREQDGFGSGEVIAKFMGILSLTPFKGFSIDGNISYYFGGDNAEDRLFLFEGLVIDFGVSLELFSGFAVFGQLEIWNPFVPGASVDNTRSTFTVGARIPTTETGAIFIGVGMVITKPDLAPELPLGTATSYKEDNLFYLSINFIEHW